MENKKKIREKFVTKKSRRNLLNTKKTISFCLLFSLQKKIEKSFLLSVLFSSFFVAIFGNVLSIRYEMSDALGVNDAEVSF